MATSDSSLPQPQEKSTLDKFLSLFSKVNGGEGGNVVLLFVAAFILMGLYYVLKPVREALILSQAGAVMKSYASAAQALLFVFVVPIYGAIAARVNRVWLISGMTLFFISNLVLFILAGGAGMEIGIAYYIWLGVFSFMVVSQFWAFANDLYTEEQGKRLFPVVGIGSTLGAWAGARIAGDVFEATGPYLLMTVAAGLLGVVIVLIVIINRRTTTVSKAESKKADEKLSKEGGFGLVMKNRYLLLIAFHVLLLNLINTVGEYVLSQMVTDTAVLQIGAGEEFQEARGNFIGSFYGTFFSWVNLAAFLVQSFLVSRLIKYIGVRGSLFIGPVISLLTYGTAAVQPVLGIFRFVKSAENANDYSTNNTVRQALFLPTSRDVKYKAKAAIDTFFGRSGDALQALIVFVGTRLAFAVPAFAIVNVVFVGLWLIVCTGIAREHKKISPEK
jgi:ATP:ADP antiporter, AAA family